MKRIKEIRPAFDKRDFLDPSKNYGIHGVEILFLLKGPEGAVQFLLSTNRQLPHVQYMILDMIKKEHLHLSENDLKIIENYSGDFTPGNEVQEVLDWVKFLNKLEIDDCLLKPTGFDLGYHSPKPLYEGQEPIRVVLKKTEFDPVSFEIISPTVYGDPVICPYLDNDAPCYYDGSSLAGQKLCEKFFLGGEEVIWEELERYYEVNFKLVE